MTWLGLLKAALIAVGAFAAFLRERRLIEAGQAEMVARSLGTVLAEIAKADNARAFIRRDFDDNPGGLRDDDGFRRRE